MELKLSPLNTSSFSFHPPSLWQLLVCTCPALQPNEREKKKKTKVGDTNQRERDRDLEERTARHSREMIVK